MDNSDVIKNIIDNAKSDKENKDLLSNIEDIDAYLKKMRIKVIKKHIMLYREDCVPQMLNINNM